MPIPLFVDVLERVVLCVVVGGKVYALGSKTVQLMSGVRSA
jgi:hypothetical protein